jgi:hypothetical protein
MSASDLKLKLISQILATNDNILLDRIEDIIKSNFQVNEPTSTYERVRVFSEEEQHKINLAVQQYENGECISDEEAQKEIQEWLED